MKAKNDITKIKRAFYPGDEWLFFKIYLHYNVANKVLAKVILPFVKSLKRKRIIDEWFFIRYSDPGFHIRLRLHVIDNNAYGDIITSLNNRLKRYISAGFVNKITIDTYVREAERYGGDDIINCEHFFCDDSKLIAEIVANDYGNNDSDRILTAIALCNCLLHSYSNNSAEQEKIISRISDNFSSKINSKSVNEIYRDMRKDIEMILPYNSSLNIIKQKSRDNRYRGDNISAISDKASVITSLIHMRMNRFFAINPNIYEAVVYYMLSKALKSFIARNSASADAIK